MGNLLLWLSRGPSHPGCDRSSVMTGSCMRNRLSVGLVTLYAISADYTHRVAISNHRLTALTDQNVTFRWRDSRHGNKKRHMTLPVDQFLRRFLLHLLPRGFVRIRNFGFLANRQRARLLPLCFRLLQAPRSIPPASPNSRRRALTRPGNVLRAAPPCMSVSGSPPLNSCSAPRQVAEANHGATTSSSDTNRAPAHIQNLRPYSHKQRPKDA